MLDSREGAPGLGRAYPQEHVAIELEPIDGQDQVLPTNGRAKQLSGPKEHRPAQQEQAREDGP
eukprot:4478831-Lingulodinium_polyedra.AAC.1